MINNLLNLNNVIIKYISYYIILIPFYNLFDKVYIGTKKLLNKVYI